MTAPVSPYPLSTTVPSDAPLQHLEDTNTNAPTNDPKSAKDPIHHDFYRHTFLSWARLGKLQKKTKIVPREPSSTSSHKDTEIQLEMESTLTPAEREKAIEQTKYSIRYIAAVGLNIAFVTACLVIGVIALIVALQPKMPTGTILLYSGSASTLFGADDPWLFCNGSAVSRITYQGLFAVIGTTYGPGNGIDTFNLPDLRARFPMGSTGANDTFLVSGGSASHTLTLAELPAHDHDQGSLQTLTNGAHTHAYSDPGHSHGGSTGNGPFGTGSFSMSSSGGFGNDGGVHSHSIPNGATGITILTDGSHTHAVSGSTGLEGQGQPFDTTPPYQTVHYIIKS